MQHTCIHYAVSLFIGKLKGNFYDSNGEPTEALRDAVKSLEKAHENKRIRDAEKARTPPCNSSQNKEKKYVWCTDKRLFKKYFWIFGV